MFVLVGKAILTADWAWANLHSSVRHACRGSGGIDCNSCADRVLYDVFCISEKVCNMHNFSQNAKFLIAFFNGKE